MLNASRINAARLNAATVLAEFQNPVTLFRQAVHAEAVARSLVPVMSWSNLAGAGRPWRAAFRDSEPLEDPNEVTWGNLQANDLPVSALHRPALPVLESPIVARWRITDVRDVPVRVVHRESTTLETVATLRWRNPPIMDQLTAVPWGRLAVRDIIAASAWPLAKVLHPNDWEIPWGQGRPPPTLVDNPTIGGPVPGPPDPDPVYVPPPGDQVALPLRCPLFDGPGDQVPLPLRQFECLRIDFMIDNQITCTRVDTGESVQCLDVRLEGDIESYSHGFTARLPYTASGMVVDGPVELLLDINGQQFLVFAERAGENGDFSGESGRSDTLTITGRSVSAELDEPASAPRNRFEEQTRTALQLMQQELPANGSWTLSAHPAFSDWTIPGGTFSYQGLSPIRAIARVAAAVGAVVQQVPGKRELLILPRYTVDPWKQETTQAEVEIDFGIVARHVRDFEPTALANGIYIAGETSDGHLVKATRTGTAGAPWLDIVTDPLITDPQAGLARARAELGATGKRDLVQLQIPLDPGISAPGLVQPGTIAMVLEDLDTFWNAQAVGWNLSAAWSDDSGLTIWQTVTVERYRDS